MLELGLLILGIIILVKGADWLVAGSSKIAQRKGISDLVVGLTIVAFGTSAPEMVVNIFASVQDQQAIVLGNVIGSNICNLFLIFGIVGLVKPLIIDKDASTHQIPFAFGATVLLLLLANNYFIAPNPEISRLDGIILFIGFIGFFYYIYHQLKKTKVKPEKTVISDSYSKLIFLVIIGLSGLILGGKLIVDNAIIIAESYGISERVIGLTIIAIGTSLPELATTLVASIKGNSGIAIGNIVGSSIFNIFFILSSSALISPMVFDTSFNVEIILILIGTVFLFLTASLGTKGKLDRWEAAVLLLGFIGYSLWLMDKELGVNIF